MLDPIMPVQPRVSVIVPTYNRAADLPPLMEALLHQHVPDGEFEIIVVNNASTDETAAVLHACQARDHRVRYVEEGRRGAAYARNAGAAVASGDLLVFIDDDVRPADGWLCELVDVFTAHPEVDCAGGRVEAAWPAPPPKWLTPVNYPPLALQLERGGGAEYLDATNAASCLITANFAVRKRVFDELGGFSTEYSRDEDREFNLRLWSHGKRGKYVRTARAWAMVQPERLTKRHHRRWYHVTGANHARMRFREVVDRDGRLVPPLRGPVLFGAPRFLYKLLLNALRRWVAAVVRWRPADMFRAECDVRYYLSYIATRRRERV